MTTYVVLASPDGGTTWEKQPEVKAGTPYGAINETRKRAGLEGPSDRSTQFVAIPKRQWAPKQMQKEIIEKWSLGPVEEKKPEPQGELA